MHLDKLKTKKAKPKLTVCSDSDDDVAILSITKETSVIPPDHITKAELIKQQQSDVHINKTLSLHPTKLKKRFAQDSNGTMYLKDKLNNNWRILLPMKLKVYALKGCHDDLGGSHLGRTKSLDKVAQHFY